MKKPIIIFITSTILLGIIALGLNTVFGYNTVSFIEQIRVNDIIISKYNFWSYLDNLKNEIYNTARLELTIQTRVWLNVDPNIFDGQFWAGLINNLAYMLNWGIFGLNVMLYPIRIGAYVISSAFAIIGINSTTPENNALYWLIEVSNFLEGLQIPYI